MVAVVAFAGGASTICQMPGLISSSTWYCISPEPSVQLSPICSLELALATRLVGGVRDTVPLHSM